MTTPDPMPMQPAAASATTRSSMARIPSIARGAWASAVTWAETSCWQYWRRAAQ